MEQKEERNVPWNRTIVVCMVALLCCFLWGSAFPGIKIGYEIFGIEGNQAGLQIMFAGIRFFLAGVMALVIGSVAYKRILLPKKTSWKPILHLSLLQTTLQYFFFYIGLGKTSGVKASIIEALNVFVALFVACLLFRQEKLKRNKILGSVLGFAGVFIMELWGSRGGSASLAGIGVGELCIFISTVAYAFSSVYLRKYSEQEYAPFVRKIEVEVETLDMVKDAVEAGADIIMLDNMDHDTMAEAMRIIDGKAEVEVSGNMTKENLAKLSGLSVNYVSSGALTHSAPIMDISLKNLHPVD